MRKVVIVQAYWPATKSKFMQAFEDHSAAMARYSELKEDSGAVVQYVRTEFSSLEELGALISGMDKHQGNELQ